MTVGIHCPSRSLWEIRADTRRKNNLMVHWNCNRRNAAVILALAEVVYSFTRCCHCTEVGALFATSYQGKDYDLIHVQCYCLMDDFVALHVRGCMWRSKAIDCSRCGHWRALSDQGKQCQRRGTHPRIRHTSTASSSFRYCDTVLGMQYTPIWSEAWFVSGQQAYLTTCFPQRHLIYFHWLYT